MFKRTPSVFLATAMIIFLARSIHASETQEYLVQKAIDLCGHQAEVTYLECITEDGSRLLADPDFFAVIKKICGTSTQIKKCLKDSFAAPLDNAVPETVQETPDTTSTTVVEAVPYNVVRQNTEVIATGTLQAINNNSPITYHTTKSTTRVIAQAPTRTSRGTSIVGSSGAPTTSRPTLSNTSQANQNTPPQRTLQSTASYTYYPTLGK